MLWLIVIAALMWILQCVLGLWQFKCFNRHFKALRQEGRVSIGKAKGKIVAGVVVMLCIDENGCIIKGKRLQGLTIFARVQPFDDCNGMYLSDMNEGACAGLNKQTKKAVLDAVENYKEFYRKQQVKPQIVAEIVNG